MEPRGREVLKQVPRQIAVARAYIEGLERDRLRLAETAQDNMRLTWECVTLANRNRAMARMLKAVDLDGFAAEVVAELIAQNDEAEETIFGCPCGHSIFDHDEGGCSFLHCKSVCA